MPPPHRLYIVAADHRDGGARAFLRPQARRLLHLRDNHRKLWPKPSLKDPPALPNSLQLSKRLFRCHRSPSSATRQACLSTENSEEPNLNRRDEGYLTRIFRILMISTSVFYQRRAMWLIEGIARRLRFDHQKPN